MKRFKGLVSLVLISLSLNALAKEMVQTRIHDIIKPEGDEKSYIVLAMDGNVYAIDEEDREMVDMAYEAKEDHLEVVLELTASSKIKSLLNQRSSVAKMGLLSVEVPMGTEDVGYQLNGPTPMDDYEVTTVGSEDEANRLFRTMRSDTRRRSQCYNRAHVWTYEMFRSRPTGRAMNAGKMWLFFTRRYIREYKYKWWFHVAPYIKVQGATEDVVLDREFARAPKGLTDWKNDYMKNKANCPVVEYYSHFSENQNAAYCYLIKTSMYYWQPFQIEELEKTGTQRRGWDSDEIDKAYRNAVKR